MAKIDVKLDIRNFSMPPNSGWTNVTAANGAEYSYKYSGGSDGRGNATVSIPNQVIEVDLICDQRYHVDKVTLTDPDGDITESHTTRSVTFTDNDADKSYSVYYSITILDTSANTTFGCDPTIHNEDD